MKRSAKCLEGSKIKTRGHIKMMDIREGRWTGQEMKKSHISSRLVKMLKITIKSKLKESTIASSLIVMTVSQSVTNYFSVLWLKLTVKYSSKSALPSIHRLPTIPFSFSRIVWRQNHLIRFQVHFSRRWRLTGCTVIIGRPPNFFLLFRPSFGLSYPCSLSSYSHKHLSPNMKEEAEKNERNNHKHIIPCYIAFIGFSIDGNLNTQREEWREEGKRRPGENVSTSLLDGMEEEET